MPCRNDPPGKDDGEVEKIIKNPILEYIPVNNVKHKRQ